MPPTTRYSSLPAAGQGHDENSDSDHDDASSLPRNSGEIRVYDRETLAQEDEAERLLAHGGSLPKRKRKRLREMKMEEGGKTSSDSGSATSSAEDLTALRRQGGRKTRSWRRWGAFTGLYAVIVAAFLGLLYGAYKATGHHGKRYQPVIMSNGTSLFAPTTILLSLDGFRADFLHRNITPTLNAFIREGVSPKYMLPSFPSVTFPNHFTLVTGKHPESHGIVGNTFWDPALQRHFHYTDAARSMQPEWWAAEPLWETAELAGVRTAIHMWPGSEAHIGSIEPMYVDKYNAQEGLEKKVERILGWLDLPGHLDAPSTPKSEIRPQLIAAYVPNVDADGHKFGPNSTEIRGTIAEVDGMLGSLFEGIAARNLTDIVNIVIVSDHGMATTSTSRLIQLEDLLDSKLIEHIDGWPLYGLRPFDSSPEFLQTLYQNLTTTSLTPQYSGKFSVHLRTNMPSRWHFSSNPRIAPLWIIPSTGNAIVTRSEFDVALAQAGNLIYHPRGLHGYDHEHPLMRAIFVARGPAFPHPAGSEVECFQNVEVYNVVCDSLGLEPVPNNGSLRLPFKTIGVHENGGGPGENLSDDVVEAAEVVPAIAPLPMFSDLPPLESAASPLPTTAGVVWTTDAQGSLVTASPETGTEAADEEQQGDGEDDSFEQNLNYKIGWLGWVKGTLQSAKDWVKGVVGAGGVKAHDQGADGADGSSA